MSRLRIGIDGYNLAMANGTGIATYGFALARTLGAMGHRVEGVFGLHVGKDPAVREALFYDTFSRAPDPKKRVPKWEQRRELLRSLGSAEALEVPITDKVEKGGFASRMPRFDRLVSSTNLFDRAYNHFRLRGRFLPLRMADPPEVMHWTYPVPIAIEGARNVYTLHDLVPLRLPYATLDDKDQYHRIVSQCVERGAHICTVSDASLNDIVAHFPKAAGRVTNTYQSAPLPIDPAEPAEADARMIEGIFGLPHRGYFLYFGAIEPKKNVGRIIEAYLSMQSATPLVIVGARAWQSDEELRLIPGGGSDGSTGTFHGHRDQKIIRLSYLPKAMLTRLVRGARAVVFPSLYEGFGLPVLEAMQLGTAVITSTTSSLPEVAGDAALLVDPYDVRGLIGAMQTLDGDPDLCRDLGARGVAQASFFSEDRYRGRLDTLYDRVMAAPAPRG